jgi:MFS family permease
MAREHCRNTALGFTLLGTVQAMLIFTITALSVPLPRIGQELRLDSSGLLLVSAAYGLSFSGLLLFGGRLADRRGARRMFVAGLAVFAAASAAAPLATAFVPLVALRFAEGVGAALAAPAAMALLRALFPSPAAYRRAMATWGGLNVIGATAGLLLSGVVATWVSWRWMFTLPVAVAGAGLLLATRLLPADRPLRPATATAASLDIPGTVLATAGIALASYGLVATGEHPWSSVAVLVPLMAGVALLAAFLYVERHLHDPLLPPGFLLRGHDGIHRTLALVAIMMSAAGTTLTFYLLVLYLQRIRDWSPLATSGAFVPYTLALLAAGRVVGPLIARFGARLVTAGGLATGAAGLLLLARLDTSTAYPTGLLPGMVLVPAGVALAFAGAGVLAVEGVPPRQTGLASGVMNTAMELGPTIGLAALMSVAAAATGPSPANETATVNGYSWALATAGAAFAVAAAVIAAVRTSPSIKETA